MTTRTTITIDEALLQRVHRFISPNDLSLLVCQLLDEKVRQLEQEELEPALREGYLEMFACLVGTKEHESVVAVHSSAATVHAALISIGAKPGKPVEYSPKFKPPTGDRIEVDVQWLDQKGKVHTTKAQDWVLDARTKKPLKTDWVFAGSGFYTDPATGKKYYMAEAGDFICVSNFAEATLDLPIESSQSTDGLLFIANPDKVPELGTPIRLVLSVKKPEDKAKSR